MSKKNKGVHKTRKKLDKTRTLPEGWKEVRLGEISKFSKGSGITKNEIIDKGIPCIRYGELYTRHNFRIKIFYSFIRNKDLDKHKIIKGNDLLFAGSGETRGEIGKCASFNHNMKAYAGGDVIVCSIDSKKLCADFASYYLNTIGRKQIDRLGQGDSIVHIYGRFLENIKMPIPPLSEQKAIVSLLETWDTAIKKTEALIVAKEKQLNWLLKKLISDQQKNPKWRTIKLEDVCEIITPSAKIQKREFKNNGKYPIIDQSKNKISGWTDDKKTLIEFEKPLVVFGDHTCVIKYLEQPFAQGADGIKILKTDKALMPKFLYFFLKTKPVGSEGYKRHFSKLRRTKIPIPPLPEQKAIASLLETWERAIAKTEALKEKYRIQKHSLMWKILTGEWRINI